MKITIFPGKYHQNGGFSMAMLVYRSVAGSPFIFRCFSLKFYMKTNLASRGFNLAVLLWNLSMYQSILTFSPTHKTLLAVVTALIKEKRQPKHCKPLVPEIPFPTKIAQHKCLWGHMKSLVRDLFQQTEPLISPKSEKSISLATRTIPENKPLCFFLAGGGMLKLLNIFAANPTSFASPTQQVFFKFKFSPSSDQDTSDDITWSLHVKVQGLKKSSDCQAEVSCHLMHVPCESPIAWLGQ